MEYDKLIDAEVKRCIKLANKHYNLQIPLPEVRYTSWKATAGQAEIREENQPPLIELSDHLLNLNGKRFIETVVPHEVAHIVQYYLIDNMNPMHGKLFKSILGDLFKCDYLYAEHELKTE